MNVRIEVHYNANGMGVLQQSSFRVKKDTITTAYEFVKSIQRECPFDIILKKVTVDGNKDLTEEVKKLFKAPTQ